MFLDIFIGIAKHTIQTISCQLIMHRNFSVRNLQIFQTEQILIEPFTIWFCTIAVFLAFIIGNDALFNRIDNQHLSWHESAFDNNVLWIDIQNTDFRCKNQSSIIRDIISGGTQTVTIKRCSYGVTIGKQDCGRTIPWFHHRCIVMIEILLLLLHRILVFPRLRNHQHHRCSKRHAVVVQEFQCVIKHCRVRTGCIDDRIDLVNFLIQQRRGHCFFSCQHSVRITADCIDFTIVSDHTIRMGTLPAWHRIGRES